MRTDPSAPSLRRATAGTSAHSRRSIPKDAEPIPIDSGGVAVLWGYGVRVFVDRRHLVLVDGVADQRRLARLHRATCRLQRLVVIGHSGGFVTFEALRLLRDVGAAFAHIDGDGSLVACYAPQETNDVRLRRAQALAATNAAGLEIARALITEKVGSQLQLLERIAPHAEAMRDAIAEARRSAAAATTGDELRWYEATAASAYWNALASTPVRFVRQELTRVPAHWLTLGARHSPLSGGSFNAITPANALLNYCYALLEAEARIASLAAGLDPEIGLLHSERRIRDSFAHDVMEPARPSVDAYVLDLLRARVFSVRDFVQTSAGGCRLMPDLARILANTAPTWAQRVRPVVQKVAAALLRADHTPERPGRGGRPRAGALHRLTPSGSTPRPVVGPRPRCAECGGPVRDPRNARCLTCERKRLATIAPQLGGAAALARLREAGQDPTHSGRASKRRARTVAARHAEARAWSRTRAQIAEDRETFRTKVLPRIRQIEVAQLARLTGLSKAQCSLARSGQRTLHPRHWAAVLGA